MAIAYTNKKEGDVYHILRDEVHIASFDPVSEETTFVADEYRKFFGPVSKEVNQIQGGAAHSDPPEETPTNITELPPGDPGSQGPTTELPNAEDLAHPGDNIDVEDDDNEPTIGELQHIVKKADSPSPSDDIVPLVGEAPLSTGATPSATGPRRTALTERVALVLFNLLGPGRSEAGGLTLEDLDEDEKDTLYLVAEKIIQVTGSSADKAVEIQQLRSQLSATQRELMAAQESNRNGDFRYNNVQLERYSDPVDLTGAPEQDPALGDLTPAFVAWAQVNFLPEVFTRRYRGRIAGVQ